MMWPPRLGRNGWSYNISPAVGVEIIRYAKGNGPFDFQQNPAAAEAESEDRRAGMKRERVKINPLLVSKARELRDRWLEQGNADPFWLLPSGRYDVGRMIAQEINREARALPALPALEAA